MTPRATVCGFFVGSQALQVGDESIEVPASALIRVNWVLEVTPKSGENQGQTSTLAEGSCDYSGGTWVGRQYVVPPGHTVRLSVSTTMVHTQDNSSFRFNPGQLEVCLEGLENTSLSTLEDC